MSDDKVRQKDLASLCFDTYPPDDGEVYVNQNTKRRHTCAECGYQGSIIPKSFWMGRGCPVCGAKKGSKNKVLNASQKVAEKDKTAKAFETYPPITPYHGVDKPRRHRCKDCGHIGLMKPDNFWHNGRGCPVCGAKMGSANKRKNMKLKVPERDQNALHFQTYPPISEYFGAFDHRRHQCSECGYIGAMTPNNFWRGRGCPVCASSGFDKDSPAILYYLKVRREGCEPLYKIGITNRTVDERYNSEDRKRIEVLRVWHYDRGADALLEEQRIKNDFSNFAYSGEDMLQSGNTELFCADVLGLDG